MRISISNADQTREQYNNRSVFCARHASMRSFSFYLNTRMDYWKPLIGTAACTLYIYIHILSFHLPFVLSRIRDFFHETKEQVLHREFKKRKKNVRNCFLHVGLTLFLSHTHWRFIFYIHIYNKNLTIHKIWIAQINLNNSKQ